MQACVVPSGVLKRLLDRPVDFIRTPRLRALHLGWNSIGDLGAQALAEGLGKSEALEELVLEAPIGNPLESS